MSTSFNLHDCAAKAGILDFSAFRNHLREHGEFNNEQVRNLYTRYYMGLVTLDDIVAKGQKKDPSPEPVKYVSRGNYSTPKPKPYQPKPVRKTVLKRQAAKNEDDLLLLFNTHEVLTTAIVIKEMELTRMQASRLFNLLVDGGVLVWEYNHISKIRFKQYRLAEVAA